MRVDAIECFSNTGFLYPNRIILNEAFKKFHDSSSEGDRKYQNEVNKIFKARSKRRIDRILHKAKFERREGNTLIYSLLDFCRNPYIIKVYI